LCQVFVGLHTRYLELRRSTVLLPVHTRTCRTHSLVTNLGNQVDRKHIVESISSWTGVGNCHCTNRRWNPGDPEASYCVNAENSQRKVTNESPPHLIGKRATIAAATRLAGGCNGSIRFSPTQVTAHVVDWAVMQGAAHANSQGIPHSRILGRRRGSAMFQGQRRMRYLSDVSTGMGSAPRELGCHRSPLAHLLLQVASQGYSYLPSRAKFEWQVTP
jgi:hypothetical protein